MPSAKTVAAVRVARSLMPAEVAMNEAAIRLFAVGTAVLTARSDGTFHPLEAQDAVERLGRATTKIFGAMQDFADAHGVLRATAIRHDVLGYGDIFDTPPVNTPHGDNRVVVPITAAA
ncbi:hypothetical protein BH09PSE4_BH09PSE4_22240 [soil metagenome]